MTENEQNNKNKNLNEGHRERMKQKIRNVGIDSFQQHEVLEMLLYYCVPRIDTNHLAHSLIEEFGSFSGVLEADIENLEKMDGMNSNRAFFLHLIPQVARYYLKDRWSEKPEIKDSVTLGNYLCDLFAGEKHETFYVISLDSQCRLIKADLIYRGTINETPVLPRMIVEYVLKNNAAAVVLSHNHPGGNLSPSEADIELTRKMLEIFNALSIKMLDHMIVGGMRYASMRSKGYIGDMARYKVKDIYEDYEYEDDVNGEWKDFF